MDSISGGMCSTKSFVSSFKAVRVAGLELYERLACAAVMHCVAVETAFLAHNYANNNNNNDKYIN